MGVIGLFTSLRYLFPSLLYWYALSLVRSTVGYSHIHKHSKTLELTEKHDKHVLQLVAQWRIQGGSLGQLPP